MKIAMILIIFLLIAAFFIVSEEKLALKDTGSLSEFGSYYSNWFGKLFDSSKNLTGYLINFDWLPDSSDDAS